MVMLFNSILLILVCTAVALETCADPQTASGNLFLHFLRRSDYSSGACASSDRRLVQVYSVLDVENHNYFAVEHPCVPGEGPFSIQGQLYDAAEQASPTNFMAPVFFLLKTWVSGIQDRIASISQDMFPASSHVRRAPLNVSSHSVQLLRMTTKSPLGGEFQVAARFASSKLLLEGTYQFEKSSLFAQKHHESGPTFVAAGTIRSSVIEGSSTLICVGFRALTHGDRHIVVTTFWKDGSEGAVFEKTFSLRLEESGGKDVRSLESEAEDEPREEFRFGPVGSHVGLVRTSVDAAGDGSTWAYFGREWKRYIGSVSLLIFLSLVKFGPKYVLRWVERRSNRIRSHDGKLQPQHANKMTPTQRADLIRKQKDIIEKMKQEDARSGYTRVK